MKIFRISICLAVLLMLCGCTDGQQANSQTTQDNSDTSQIIRHTGVAVATPFGDVYIPDQWDIPVEAKTTEGDKTEVVFFSEGIDLYKLVFSSDSQGAVAKCKTEDGTVYMAVHMFELENVEDVILSKQESLNDIMAQLSEYMI